MEVIIQPNAERAAQAADFIARALAYSVSMDGDQMFVATPGGAEGYLLKRVHPANILDQMFHVGNFPGTSA